MRKPNRMTWRVLAHADGRSVSLENAGEFDEIVLGDWLHVEQMDTNRYWMRFGDADCWVTIDPKAGNATQIRLSPGLQGPRGPKVEIEGYPKQTWKSRRRNRR